jgi:hypothetical protein
VAMIPPHVAHDQVQIRIYDRRSPTIRTTASRGASPHDADALRR